MDRQSVNEPLSFYEVTRSWAEGYMLPGAGYPSEEEANGVTEGLAQLGSVDDGGVDKPTTATPGAVNTPVLYWSGRGEVACVTHMPPRDTDRWSHERWTEIPQVVRGRHRIRYQCQHCADSKTPIVHQRLHTHRW